MLEVTAVADQPLAVGVGGRGMRGATQRYVPGSAVRGAYAQRWLAEHGDYGPPGPPRDRFVRLFERSDVRFSPFLVDEAAPASLAELRHKYAPRPDCARATWNAAVDPQWEHLRRCPQCQQPLAYGKGEIANVTTTERIRVALDDDETAREGVLFAREAMTAGTALRGHITDDDPWLAQVTQLRFGGQRSTSGAVGVSTRRVAGPPPPALADDAHTVIVWLAGPGVFVDAAGRPTDRPADSEVAALLDVAATVERAWTRPLRIGGWHLASGLPKPVETAVSPGSTYRIRCSTPPPLEGLRRLAGTGIGLRRNEGFGWVAPLPGRAHPTGEEGTA